MANELQKKSGLVPAALEQQKIPEEQSALRKQVAQEGSLKDQQELVKPQATKAAGEVSGPIGRIFNRILGVNETRTDTAALAFNRDQMRNYLEHTLKLADGEWFRGAKLDGVSDKLMEMLDKDRNGRVGWAEFQAFRSEVLGQLAPGMAPGSPEADVRKAATARFGQVDASRDKKLGLSELQNGAKGQLPQGTEHADLISQLGARIALDAGDTDQRTKPVAERDLTLDEWVQAAVQLAFVR